MSNTLVTTQSDDPSTIPAVSAKAQEMADRGRWKQASAPRTGALLRTLAASKPGGRLLEVGGGIAVGSGWLLDGMDETATLTILEIHTKFANICKSLLADDPRATVVNTDAIEWLEQYSGPPFDLVFVDTTSAKFHRRDLVFACMAKGGLFIADDLLPQEKWAADHAAKVELFRREIMTETCLVPTLMDWSSGLFVGAYRG